MYVDPAIITIDLLPNAMAARGVHITARQAKSIAVGRRLPFFPSPIDKRLVIAPAALDRALIAGQAEAEKTFHGACEINRRRASRNEDEMPSRRRRGR